VLRKPKMILIDVDGTLVDSVPDLAFCVDATMDRLDLPRRGEAAVRLWVGNGVERLVERALTNDLEGKPDPGLFSRALPIFNALYADNTAKRSRLYPGVRVGLDYLKASGYRLGCVTNKAACFTEPLLEELGVHEDFEVVVSGDTTARKKPDPMPLLYAAEAMGSRPEDSLMIGDSKSDVQAARAAGFQIICMSYGYNHGEDIRRYEPDAVVDSMAQLPGLL
jgi:phosphoglycolate phosphatase